MYTYIYIYYVHMNWRICPGRLESEVLFHWSRSPEFLLAIAMHGHPILASPTLRWAEGSRRWQKKDLGNLGNTGFTGFLWFWGTVNFAWAMRLHVGWRCQCGVQLRCWPTSTKPGKSWTPICTRSWIMCRWWWNCGKSARDWLWP